MYYQNSKYALNRTSSLTYATGIRAIIALPNNTTVKTGDGSKANPWRIAIPKYTAESMTELADVESDGIDGLFAEGDTVKIKPKEGRIGLITFYNDDDEEVDVVCTIAADGSCSFVMPAFNVHFTVIIAENPTTLDDSKNVLVVGGSLILASALLITGCCLRRR